jgi:tetratricopeptide (TPR) repeat protein
MARARAARARFFAALIPVLVLCASCATHLSQAKAAYAEGQELSRRYQTEQAVAAYKRSLVESSNEVRHKPSAQAFMLKGMAEVNLGLWRDAELSFLKASGLGFEAGEAWAADVSVLGLAISFENLGLAEPALRAYENLLGRSAFKPVRLAAAQKFFDLSLARTLGLGDKERGRALADLARTIEKLEAGDFACGYHHYMHSQVESHRGDIRRSYEEAVTARELGLPSEKVLRDNDNQIVFCRDTLVGTLPAPERDSFSAAHASWTKKWGWKDARTPGWKQE